MAAAVAVVVVVAAAAAAAAVVILAVALAEEQVRIVLDDFRLLKEGEAVLAAAARWLEGLGFLADCDCLTEIAHVA